MFFHTSLSRSKEVARSRNTNDGMSILEYVCVCVRMHVGHQASSRVFSFPLVQFGEYWLSLVLIHDGPCFIIILKMNLIGRGRRSGRVGCVCVCVCVNTLNIRPWAMCWTTPGEIALMSDVSGCQLTLNETCGTDWPPAKKKRKICANKGWSQPAMIKICL